MSLRNTLKSTYYQHIDIEMPANTLNSKLPNLVNITIFSIGECPSNSPFLKDTGAEAHCF